MRSFTWLSPGWALGHVLSWIQRVRKSLLTQRPAIRWALAATIVVVLGLLAYLGSAALTTSESSYLGSGRRYGSEDLAKISRALDRARVPYQVDDLRRVAVLSDQREQAETAIAKLELGPRLPGEIRDQLPTSQIWESPRDKENRENQDQAKILEAMISDLDGIVGSFVWINRPKPRLGLQPVSKPSAFVRLETEGDRQLPFRTVQVITTILTGYEPGLTADAVTVLDRRGHKYLDAGNPALSVLSHNRAREEELSQEILEQLDWIKGVRVSVQLPEPLTTTSGTIPGQGEPARSQSQGRGARPASGNPEAGNALIAINKPLGTTEVSPSPANSPISGTGRDLPVESGRIWVKVPRSYYYQVSILPSHKEPSLEELQKLVTRTEEQIKTGIALVVPQSGPGSWKTTIDVIPDEVPLDRPPAVRSPVDTRRVALDWGIAGAMGAMAAVLVMTGSWILSARRSSGRPETVKRGLRRHGGSAGAPGPSERLREFVRRNPESAVSVLERWTSQGGDGS